MKKSILLLATIAVLAPCFPVATHAATHVYDVKADWSSTQNPNGPWSYRYSILLMQPEPVDAWVGGGGTISRSPVAFWDVQAGDVFVITSPLVLYGQPNIVWTAPADGTIDISGAVWNGVDNFNRAADWALSHNGQVLKNGHISAIDAYNRSAPFNFSSDAAGLASLQNISVVVGDQVKLAFEPTTSVTAFIGVNFAVSLTTEGQPDTTPPSITCPPAVTVQGSANVPLANFAGGSVSDDEDPNPTVTHEGDAVSGSCPMTIVRTYKATDASGNSDTCTQIITVNNLFAADAVIWHQPLARNGASEDTDPSAGRTVKYRFKRGSTIPIQIHALDCAGADVTSIANVIGQVTVFGDSNCEGAADADAEPIEFNGVGGGGGVMDKIGGHLKYNLDTKSLPTTTQRYILRVTITDTSTGEEKFEEVLLQAK